VQPLQGVMVSLEPRDALFNGEPGLRCVIHRAYTGEHGKIAIRTVVAHGGSQNNPPTRKEKHSNEPSRWTSCHTAASFVAGGGFTEVRTEHTVAPLRPDAPAQGADKQRQRLDFIDCLRGFACLWVLLHHSFETVPLTAQFHDGPLGLLTATAKIGWLGVSLFLVLSGFCLYYPLVRRDEVSSVRLNIRQFAQRRFLRIMPPYLAALAIFSVMALYAARHSLPWPETVRVRDIVTHALMLHNLRPSTFASINPAFWSLALEVQLYIVFPIWVWIAARRGLRTMAFVAFGSAVVWQLAAYLRYGLSPEWQPSLAVAYHALPARWFEFTAGMVAAACVARPKPIHARIAVTSAAILIGPALWFVCKVSRFGPLCDQAWGVIFASAVVLLARVRHGAFTHPCLRWMTLLGTVSYSVYLIHQPLFGLLLPENLHLAVADWMSVLLFGGVRMLLVTALGVVFFILLERPFIARAARVGRPVPAPPTAENLPGLPQPIAAVNPQSTAIPSALP